MALLHEQYDIDGDLVLFRCVECGHVEQSLGALHGHCEQHREGWTRFDIMLPLTSRSMADGEELMALTEVLRVRETEEIELSDVPAFDERPSVLQRALAPLRRLWPTEVGE